MVRARIRKRERTAPAVGTREKNALSVVDAQAPGRSARLAKVLRSNKKLLVGLVLMLIIVGSVLLSPLLSPYDPADQELQDRLAPPVWAAGGTVDHLLGTDHLGRDMLSRIMHGGRISLLIGVGAVLLSGTIGVTLGLLSGFFGGRLDTILMRGADLQLAFPQVVFVILILVILGRSLTTIIVVIALSDWVIYSRLIRGRSLVEKQQEYIEAARAIGATNGRVLFIHLLPNLASLIIVVGTLEFGVMILLASSLSFLGIGVQPPTPAWGRMLSDGREYLAIAWWVSTLPGLAIALTVVAANFIGDGLQEALGIE